MAKLSKKNKAKWVKALLSGKYVQGKGGLVTEVPRYKLDEYGHEVDVGYDKEYCCLGVACQIRIARKADEAFCTEHFLDTKTQQKLAAMNDGTSEQKAKSFKQIAKWIDKNL